MVQLSQSNILSIAQNNDLSIPGIEQLSLPEKVMQFGTGVLLRGLPDYFIDKANKQGIFNGRVVIVKSTAHGDMEVFKNQNGLYTHCIRGTFKGNIVEEDIINASISRVLSANDEWHTILECAANPLMEIVISNTTEVGINLDKDDRINDEPPKSFPGKLLAFLYKRYQVFNGDSTKGMIIIPTELIVNNGTKLRDVLVELATINLLDSQFIEWVKNANHFCNSLVDRIVPGRLPLANQHAFKLKYNYNDDLMILSEPYCLWAIEVKSDFIKEKLSFSKTDDGVIIAADIHKFRELKLRLLNGTHTFACGLAYLAGFSTVKNAMEDEVFGRYVSELMKKEIAPTIISESITTSDAEAFSSCVLDRFKNPFIEHQWLSISVQFSSKMKLRNVPLLLKYYEKYDTVPHLMSLGFAAYIAFLKVIISGPNYLGSLNGKTYVVQDDHAGWFADVYAKKGGAELVSDVLSDIDFWNENLDLLPGFKNAVTEQYLEIVKGNVLDLLNRAVGSDSNSKTLNLIKHSIT